MSIEYETNAKLLLESNNMSKAETIAITWIQGSDVINLYQGGSQAVKMSKDQLLRLSRLAEQIGDDLNPGAGSLPRSA